LRMPTIMTDCAMQVHGFLGQNAFTAEDADTLRA